MAAWLSVIAAQDDDWGGAEVSASVGRLMPESIVATVAFRLLLAVGIGAGGGFAFGRLARRLRRESEAAGKRNVAGFLLWPAFLFVTFFGGIVIGAIVRGGEVLPSFTTQLFTAAVLTAWAVSRPPKSNG